MSEVRLKVFSGNFYRLLAEQSAGIINVPLGEATVTSFPDGESFVKINENIRGADVFIIQSTCPPSNHHLMELLIMIDAARRASAQASRRHAVSTVMRAQDRKDQPRVPITAKLVANLWWLRAPIRVLTMDLHSSKSRDSSTIPVDHLYASPVFFDYLAKDMPPGLVGLFRPMSEA